MMNESIRNAVEDELSIAYVRSGRHLPSDNAAVVARSILESVRFASAYEVRAAFRKAKAARGIPTRKDLSDALVRVREERLRRVPVPANGTMTYADYVRMTGDDRISRMARGERVDA